MIKLEDKTRYGESAELFFNYSNTTASQSTCIGRLYENLQYYREKALDLACEKLLLDGICDGCESDSQTYCDKVCRLVDND